MRSRTDKAIDVGFVALVGLGWLWSLLALVLGRPVSAFSYFLATTTALIAALGWVREGRRGQATN